MGNRPKSRAVRADRDPGGAKIATEMTAAVRRLGLKLTPQRLAVIRALGAARSHPTAQELFEALRPELPTMSFATVYNTLAALSSAGVCGTRCLTRGSARFDPITAPHDHAVCDRCGLVLDVAREGAPERPPAGPPGFDVRAVERVYRGLCHDCHAAGVAERKLYPRAADLVSRLDAGATRSARGAAALDAGRADPRSPAPPDDLRSARRTRP
jgi:Fur family peroxide stress response transcriptional regulator